MKTLVQLLHCTQFLLQLNQHLRMVNLQWAIGAILPHYPGQNFWNIHKTKHPETESPE